MIQAFLYGIILSFSLIMPLGVQNMYIFNQGANQSHFLNAWPAVMTAALCDTILILLAIFGVSITVLTVPWLKNIILSIGLVFLTYMGWSAWHAKSIVRSESQKSATAKRQMLFAASVSILNPHALLDTTAIIGTNSLQFMGREKFVFTFACIAVSYIWFFSLSAAGHYLKRHDTTGRAILKINRVSAIIMWVVAIYLCFELIYR
jgi:L-lysine exporter family protein LysE/ArgO